MRKNNSIKSKKRKTSPKNPTWTADVKKHPEMERQLKKAIESYNAGNMGEAIGALEKIIVDYPDRAPILWYLGGFYFVNEQPERAVPYFQRATVLAPKVERASLGLFNALWETNRRHEALEEMKRFQLLTHWSCKDYLNIMAEINEKWLEEKPAKTKREKQAKS
jgi:tetratricopeptide (TPR) repeat protein